MKIFKISSKNFQEIIVQAAEVLKNGGTVIFPTDTVYGLGCNAFDKKAVQKIFEIKKRPKEKALPIFVKDIKMAKKLAYINKRQEKFLRKVWFTRPNFSGKSQKLVEIRPKIWAGKGKITVVLKKKKFTPQILCGKTNSIGLRIPKYRFIQKLLAKVNSPIIGTSANISGQPASGKIKEVLKQFENQKNQAGLIIDAGNLPKSKPSTIVDLTDGVPKILRIGAIDLNSKIKMQNVK